MSTRNDDERQAVAHWLDRNYGPSVRASEWLGGGPNGGHDWLAAADDVLEVARRNRQGSHNPAQGGRTGAQGTPGGPEVSQGADGASVRSLGDRLRDAIQTWRSQTSEPDPANDEVIEVGGYSFWRLVQEVGDLADEADRLQNERDAIDESLWRFKESFHEVTDGKPLAEWHAEHCGAVEGADQMRRERDQARGDLAAQEGIAQEMKASLDRLHTWAGLLELLDAHWPEDIFPTLTDDAARDTGPRLVSALRRVDRAEAAVDRVRALASRWDERHGTALGRISVGNAAFAIRRALDGGTEADRG